MSAVDHTEWAAACSLQGLQADNEYEKLLAVFSLAQVCSAKVKNCFEKYKEFYLLSLW